MASIAELQAEIARRQQPRGVTQQDIQSEIARRQQVTTAPQAAPVGPQEPLAEIPIQAPTAQPISDRGALLRSAEGQRIAQERATEGRPVAAVVEPALTLATGALAEPAAGLAGLATLPFAGPEAAAGAVEATRQALTFQPPTEAGQAGLQAVGETLEPLTQAIQAAEETLGDVGFEIGGPVGGAIGATVPTALLTALGVRRTPRGAPDITPQRAVEIRDVIAASERQGIDVLTSDIFQPKSIMSRLSQQFSERIPVLGVGGKRSAQQTQRIEALERLEQSTPRIEAADIFTSLEKNANKTRVAAGKRINDVTESMTPLGSIPVENSVNRIDQALARLERPGKLKNDVLIAELNNIKQTLTETGQDFKSLREFRTDARAISESVDAAGRSQLRSSDKALMDGVIKGITEDLDGFVLNNSDARTLSKYKAADGIYRQEALKLTKSRLKSVLDKGEVKPELINNLLFSSSPSEVRLLFNNLDSTGRQNARMSLYRRALDNSTKQGEISPQRFVSELGKLDNNFNTFFRGEARAELNGLKRLLETTGRAGEAGVVTPTGQALQIPGTTAVLAGAAVGNPAAIGTLLSASTIGLAARVYESAGVRNMLIQLGKAPKRSTLAADLRKSIPLLLAEASREIEREEQASQTPSEAP